MKQQLSNSFILRFDDICPTMRWDIWSEIESALIDSGVKPILAIVPDNRDPVLQQGPPAQDFWDRARRWQEMGWTIALHGYQHLYVAQAAGLVNLRKKSEFASLSEHDQREKLRRGLEIFAAEGISSHVWIGPGNAFDDVTVSLLPQFGIDTISAGWFWRPFTGPHDVTWVPCQLSVFRPVPAGVWTVCYHHNGWSDLDMAEFKEGLQHYRNNILSLDEALAQFPPTHARWSYRFCTSRRLSDFVVRAQLKIWKICFARRSGRLLLDRRNTTWSVTPA
jgi:Uncharacterized protein conserved in bacteria (DUF2334)